MKTPLKRTEILILAFVMLAGILLRAHDLGSKSITSDEAFDLYKALAPASLIITDRETVHPLFRLVYHLWLGFGTNEAHLRSLSVACAGISIVLIYVLSLLLFSRREAIISAILLATSPVHVTYSQEARMYPFLMMLVLASVSMFALFMKTSRKAHLVAAILIIAGAAYVHAYSVFIWLAIFACHLYAVARRGMDRGGLFLHVLYPILLVPLSLVYITVMKSGFGGWLDAMIKKPGLDSIYGLFEVFTLGYVHITSSSEASYILLVSAASLLIPLVIFLVFRAILSGRRDNGAIALTVTCLLLPIGAIFAASQFRNLFLERYLVFCLPFYLVLLARGIALFKSRAAVFISLSGILILSLIYVQRSYDFYDEEWRPGALAVKREFRKGDVITFYSPWFGQGPFMYYNDFHGLPGENFKYYSLPIIPGDDSPKPGIESVAAREVDLLFGQYGRIWLVYQNSYTDPGNLVMKYLSAAARGKIVAQTKGYAVILFERQ
jgi:mannosyltransferase